MEKWANFLLEKYPKADKEVTLLSVWLHDIGHYPIRKTDHAIRSEKVAKNFLMKEKVDEKKIKEILHCVRSHRCKDIQPESLEARILSCADSASHMTDTSLYSSMISQNRAWLAMEKLERDYRDIATFPEVKNKLKKIYLSWKNLIQAFLEFEK